MNINQNEIDEKNNINNSVPKEENEIKINEDFNEENQIIMEEEIDNEKEKENEKEIKEEDKKSIDSGLDLTDDKDFEHMKEELDKAINFIDYFLVIGIPPKIFMENWLYQLDVDSLNEKFKNNYPKIISYFPNYKKQTIAFEDDILAHCFPNGFKAIFSDTQPKTQIFSLILDNNYFNLNFPKKYLTCLIFYESINKYKELYEIYKQYMKEENKENIKNDISGIKPEEKNEININNESKNDLEINHDIYIPKCLMLMSLYPYFAEFEKILFEIYKYSLIKTDNSINQISKISEINQNVNNQNTNETNNNLEETQIKKEMKNDNNNSNKIIVPMDKIIENLLIELPVPPRGLFTVEYTLINQERQLKQNLMNELPLVDINLKRLFTFNIKDIVDMYQYLFLETRILFFSEDIQSLNMYISGLLALLYPFQYQFQVITNLPLDDFEIIESISPFIAGVNIAYTENYIESRNFNLSDAILIVDIDNTKLSFVNKVNDIPGFPKGYRKTLERNLQNIKTKYLKDFDFSVIKLNHSKSKYQKSSISNRTNIKNSELINSSNVLNNDQSSSLYKIQTLNINNDGQKNFFEVIDELGEDDNNSPYGNFNIDYDFNKEVNELFFNFNANLLSGYSKFLNTDFYSSNISPSLEVLFKVEEFLNQVSSADRAFYDKFINEAQLFQEFLFLRMVPKNTREKIQILSFDEKINENSASVFYRPPPSVFINSREYDFINTYKVLKPRSLTKKEIEFYQKKENKIKLLNYGIIVKEENGEISFEYPIFPGLTTKYFFKNNISEYFLPTNLNENIESINIDIVSKSHLGGVQMRVNDMDNYIYLCWMQMWAITFWYCDQKEKRYRFQELLKVLSIKS